jgi:hypothetical protein
MNDNWVLQQIRKAYLNRLIGWSVVLACLLLFILWQHRYIANFVQGPFTLGRAELDSITDVSATPRYFARVSGSKAIDTGIRQITVRKRHGVETGRSVSGEFFVLMIEDRLLVVQGSSGQHTTVEGELVPLSTELGRKLFGTPDMQHIRNRFYPFVLDDAAFRVPGYIAGAIIAVIGCLALWLGFRALKRYMAPATDPLVARLASWGDPARIAAEAEAGSRSPRHKMGGWIVTDKYLIRSTFREFSLHRLADLQWAYKRVTSQNMVKSYAAVLVMNGISVNVLGTEKNVDAVLTLASERVPWALFGYSKEIEDHFKQNRQGFTAAIEQRRRDWAAQAGAVAT